MHAQQKGRANLDKCDFSGLEKFEFNRLGNLDLDAQGSWEQEPTLRDQIIVISRPVRGHGDPMLLRGLEQRLGTEGRCNMSLDRV